MTHTVPLLTSEAARILEVTPETIRAWELSGRLPAMRTARGVRLFDRADVERLARERREGSAVQVEPVNGAAI
jgi:excisionase family DNA binding protein